jgi:hypothetical protein
MLRKKSVPSETPKVDPKQNDNRKLWPRIVKDNTKKAGK